MQMHLLFHADIKTNGCGSLAAFSSRNCIIIVGIIIIIIIIIIIVVVVVGAYGCV